MLNIFLSTLPIFLLILTGWGTKHFFIKEEPFWKLIEKLVYYLFFPALLIVKLNHANLDFGQSSFALYATILSTCLVALLVFMSKYLFHTQNSTFTSLFQGSVRYNSYVFIAMSASLFGSEGIALSGIFIAYMIILTNIMSVLVMNAYGDGVKKSWQTILSALIKNPLIVGALVGVLLNVIQLEIKGFLLVFMNYLADASTPLSLMAVGAGLVLFVEKSRVLSASYASFLKLLVLPMITIGLVKLFNVSGAVANIAVLYACVPTAGNAYILARQMGGDAPVMASIITLTTLLSILSIPLMLGTFQVLT